MNKGKRIKHIVLSIALATLITGCNEKNSSSDNTLPAIEPNNILDPNGNFSLYVSNQSFEIDPVDMIVSIDGVRIVANHYTVGKQHTLIEYKLNLSPGDHTIHVVSRLGDATLTETFTLEESKPPINAGVVTYWYSLKNPSLPKSLKFELATRPVRYE